MVFRRVPAKALKTVVLPANGSPDYANLHLLTLRIA